MQYEQLKPRDKSIEGLWNPESTDRPYGYFAAQTDFALKAFKLGLAGSITESLEQFTALPRKIMGNKKSPKSEGSLWRQTASNLKLPDHYDNIELADQLFAAYLSHPESSAYKQRDPENDKGRRSGAYIHDYDASETAIRLHFVESRRGPSSEFAVSSMIDRRADMQRMMMLIRQNAYTPTPTIITSGSWMYNIRSVINVMPDTFRDSAGSPPHLSLNGDSYWGQLVTSDGGCNTKRAEQFQAKLKEAGNLDEMVAAMPFQVLFLKAPIEDFYEYYGIVK